MATTLRLGVHEVPAADYHADVSCLTQSGAKLLVPPSCPAAFRYWRDNPQPPNRMFDLGHAAHRAALGAGADYEDTEFTSWRSAKAKQAAKAIREAGSVPLLQQEWEQVRQMVVRLHQQVPGLFNDTGATEQTIVWEDAATMVECKAMLDWWRRGDGTRRAWVLDYKTCADASDVAVAASVARYGYHVQAAWYLEAVASLGYGDAWMAFVFQEKTPPYLVNIVELDYQALEIGHEIGAHAREVYRDCLHSGVWPGHTTERIKTISLPRWAVYQHNNREF